MKKSGKSQPAIHRKYTYLLGRKCEYCNAPIEDQARPNKRHCLPWEDENGHIHTCRRLKHSMIHDKETVLLQELNAKLKDTDRNIKRVLIDHGDYVGTEILDAYNIQLDESIRFRYDGSSIVSFDFLSYVIHTDIFKNKHKILSYE
jgi:hypothetical protein